MIIVQRIIFLQFADQVVVLNAGRVMAARKHDETHKIYDPKSLQERDCGNGEDEKCSFPQRSKDCLRLREERQQTWSPTV